jgi:predicted DNA-binding transcriptional regulator AlpA
MSSPARTASPEVPVAGRPLFLDVPGLAAALGVPVSTIYNWTREVGPQSIPRVRLGKRYGFDLGEVVAWLKENHDPRHDGQRPRPTRGRRVAAR